MAPAIIPEAAASERKTFQEDTEEFSSARRHHLNFVIGAAHLASQSSCVVLNDVEIVLALLVPFPCEPKDNLQPIVRAGTQRQSLQNRARRVGDAKRIAGAMRLVSTSRVAVFSGSAAPEPCASAATNWAVSAAAAISFLRASTQAV